LKGRSKQTRNAQRRPDEVKRGWSGFIAYCLKGIPAGGTAEAQAKPGSGSHPKPGRPNTNSINLEMPAL
jgi:hypothetical protein